MSRAPWIHVDRVPGPGDVTALDPEETRHAARARRLGPGDAVVLTDGCGTTAQAELVETGRSAVLARVVEVREHAADVPAIHLASALPKGDRIATLLSMATQLGIAAFVPLVCRHSVVTVGAGAPARWDRILRESAKQSRRAFVPTIEDARTPDDLLDDVAYDRVWLMDPEAGPTLGRVADAEGATHLVVVGPEGGLTEDERRALSSDATRPVRLGPGILRIETAAVAAVAALRARLGP